MIFIRYIEPEELAMALVDMAERYAARRRQRKHRKGENQTSRPHQNHECSNE